MPENKIEVNGKNPSKMAENIAIHRFAESAKPEGERICYDPYAIHFLDPETLKLLKLLRDNPELAKKNAKETEELFPGFTNSIIARIRYFDDFVKESLNEGIEQIVILGAGYDTRAYRIDGLRNIKVFEVDHPDTQSFKIQKIEEIFGSVPCHVVYVPVDFEKETLDQKLFDKGYDLSKKTLFVMEGLIMYILPESVDRMLSFIVENSPKGSIVLFDYIHESIVERTCELGKNLQNYTEERREPLQFGLKEDIIEDFLKERGFSNIINITGDDYKAYFEGRDYGVVCNLLYFVHAVVE
jgi:methyltransferase (TIGR00027 family)